MTPDSQLTLEQQVTSLALSKKLKELGVKAESLYAYYGNAGQWNDVIVDMSMYSDVDDEFKECKLLPAYTVAELGELLPFCVEDKHLNIYKREDGWHVSYETSDSYFHREVSKTEADARALMLIYLIEHKLITL